MVLEKICLVDGSIWSNLAFFLTVAAIVVFNFEYVLDQWDWP